MSASCVLLTELGLLLTYPIIGGESLPNVLFLVEYTQCWLYVLIFDSMVADSNFCVIYLEMKGAVCGSWVCCLILYFVAVPLSWHISVLCISGKHVLINPVWYFTNTDQEAGAPIGLSHGFPERHPTLCSGSVSHLG